MDDRPGRPSFDLHAGLAAALAAAVGPGLERCGRAWRCGNLFVTDGAITALQAMGLVSKEGWRARATMAGAVRAELASGLWSKGVSLSVVGTAPARVVARWNGPTSMGEAEMARFDSPGEARRAVQSLELQA